MTAGNVHSYGPAPIYGVVLLACAPETLINNCTPPGVWWRSCQDLPADASGYPVLEIVSHDRYVLEDFVRQYWGDDEAWQVFRGEETHGPNRT